jgi:hypothetical protein
MTLTPSQIEVLARFDGWEFFKQDEPPLVSVWERVAKDGNAQQLKDWKMDNHLTSPGVLIEMRLKLKKRVEEEIQDERKTQWQVYDVGQLILKGDYTAAAIKTVEIIQKLEA